MLIIKIFWKVEALYPWLSLTAATLQKYLVPTFNTLKRVLEYEKIEHIVLRPLSIKHPRVVILLIFFHMDGWFLLNAVTNFIDMAGPASDQSQFQLFTGMAGAASDQLQFQLTIEETNFLKNFKGNCNNMLNIKKGFKYRWNRGKNAIYTMSQSKMAW